MDYIVGRESRMCTLLLISSVIMLTAVRGCDANGRDLQWGYQYLTIFANHLGPDSHVVPVWQGHIVPVYVDPDGTIREMASAIASHPDTKVDVKDINRLVLFSADERGKIKNELEYHLSPGRQLSNGSTVFYVIQ